MACTPPQSKRLRVTDDRFRWCSWSETGVAAAIFDGPCRAHTGGQQPWPISFRHPPPPTHNPPTNHPPTHLAMARMPMALATMPALGVPWRDLRANSAGRKPRSAMPCRR